MMRLSSLLQRQVRLGAWVCRLLPTNLLLPYSTAELPRRRPASIAASAAIRAMAANIAALDGSDSGSDTDTDTGSSSDSDSDCDSCSDSGHDYAYVGASTRKGPLSDFPTYFSSPYNIADHNAGAPVGGLRTTPIHSCGVAAPCTHCKSLVFPSERGKCCANGALVLDPTDNPTIHRKERELLTAPKMSFYSGMINSLLSFAVLGTTPTKERGGKCMQNKYPGVTTLHGRTYHLWVPPSDKGPARGHTRGGADLPDIFLIDRVSLLKDNRVGHALLKRWRQFLHSRHPLARTLAHAFERREGKRAISISIAPSTAISDEMEVALVFPDDAGGPPARFALAFPLRSRRRDKFKSVFVPETSALFDVMHYPLLNPKGTGGFNVPATNSRRIRCAGIVASAASRVVCGMERNGTRRQFTLLKWAKANLYQNLRLHYLGRLMQEWALNQFSRYQHDYLEHLRNLGRACFVAPMAAVRAGAAAIEESRRRVYLSSKVVGSKRYLDGKVADGMAIVQVSPSPPDVSGAPFNRRLPCPAPALPQTLQTFGKPTFFITFTANSKWPEIDKLLVADQSVLDRPDATMRVFKIKLQALLDDLRAGDSFGRKAMFVFYVIEFQKRGLPHAHSEWLRVQLSRLHCLTPSRALLLCSCCTHQRAPAFYCGRDRRDHLCGAARHERLQHGALC